MDSKSPIRIGINGGDGRVAKALLRLALSDPEFMRRFQVVGLNAPDREVSRLADNLMHDSVHGPLRWQGRTIQIHTEDDNLFVEGTTALTGQVRVMGCRNPAELQWGVDEVDVVLECTGVFRSAESCMPHIANGARRVLISAPKKGGTVNATCVFGVNHNHIVSGSTVISAASCTTNALAPLVKALVDGGVQVRSGSATSIHAMTASQHLLDGHQRDSKKRRLGAAAALNMIPTETGAAKALREVFPQLAAHITARSVRVPVHNGSLVILDFVSDDITKDQVTTALRTYGQQHSSLGVAEFSEEPLVSSRILGRTTASIFDAGMTEVTEDGSCGTVATWYDNEVGYAAQMLRLLGHWIDVDCQTA